MNEKILNDILNLKKALQSSEEYKNLMLKNKELENSDEAKILSYKKDMAILNYEDALKHFDKNSKEVLEKEKDMAEAIYNLNHLKVVEEYNKAFDEYNIYINKINEECFSFFKESKND